MWFPPPHTHTHWLKLGSVCIENQAVGLAKRKRSFLWGQRSLWAHFSGKLGELHACRLAPLPAPCSSLEHLATPTHHVVLLIQDYPFFWEPACFLHCCATCSVVSRKPCQACRQKHFCMAFWCLWVQAPSAEVWHGSALSYTISPSLLSMSLLPRHQQDSSLFSGILWCSRLDFPSVLPLA